MLLLSAAAGAFLIRPYWGLFVIIACNLLAVSEVWLSVRAWRLAARKDVPACAFLFVAGVAGLCTTAHVGLVPWPLLAYNVMRGWLAPWSPGILLCFALWSLPVFPFAAAIGVVRLLDFPQVARRRRLFMWSLRTALAALPGAMVLTALLVSFVWVRAHEAWLVAASPEARTVRRYLDAMERRDYRGMSREMCVLRYAPDGPARGRFFPEAPLSDFAESDRIRLAFVTEQLKANVDDFVCQVPDMAIHIIDVRALVPGIQYEDGSWEMREALPGHTEVVVAEWDGTGWHREYITVRTSLSPDLKIDLSSHMPHWAPEGCNPRPNVARRLHYFVKDAREFTRRHLAD